jgi:hypothetical protein
MLIDSNDKDKGIAFLNQVKAGLGTFKILLDPKASLEDPKNVLQVSTGVGSVPVMSADLRFSYFAKNFDDTVGTSDSWVARHDIPAGPTTCALTSGTESALFGTPFLRSGGLAFWADHYAEATDSAEGWLADPDGCKNKKRFGLDVDFWFVLRDEGMVYSDDSDARW